jgi:hypothetical protein
MAAHPPPRYPQRRCLDDPAQLADVVHGTRFVDGEPRILGAA